MWRVPNTSLKKSMCVCVCVCVCECWELVCLFIYLFIFLSCVFGLKKLMTDNT